MAPTKPDPPSCPARRASLHRTGHGGRLATDAGIVEEVPEEPTTQGRLRRQKNLNHEGEQLRARLHQ